MLEIIRARRAQEPDVSRRAPGEERRSAPRSVKISTEWPERGAVEWLFKEAGRIR